MYDMVSEAQELDRANAVMPKSYSGGHVPDLKLFGRVYRNGKLIKISNQK